MIAVFWDYENTKVPAEGINLPLAEALIAYSGSLGHPTILRVYSNWQREKSAVSVQALYSLGFEPIHVSMGKPNSVDLKLAIDCLSTAYNHSEIEHFIIVTADKDFIPLVNALKALKKRVIIVGKADVVSEHLMLSAHNFVPLETLPKYLNSCQELVDEDPQEESNFTEQKNDRIDSSQWLIIIAQIQKAFQENDPLQYWYGRYGHLHKYIRAAKKNGEITVRNKTLQGVVNRLVEVGMLIFQDEGCYRITEDLEAKKRDIIKQLVKNH
jgi:uncharacterized protein (TIGR00288 family)